MIEGAAVLHDDRVAGVLHGGWQGGHLLSLLPPSSCEAAELRPWLTFEEKHVHVYPEIPHGGALEGGHLLPGKLRAVAAASVAAKPLPDSFSFEVPHVRQMHSWDCGLACALMVLRALGREAHDLKHLQRLCGTTSVWTVDLAHLLRHFALDVCFLTVTIGANPGFALETFYKETMEEDRKRVNFLFERAAQAGIHIQRRSLTGQELAALVLSGSFLAIALVDKRKFSHPGAGATCLPECCGTGAGYTGHYVVVCGYDRSREVYKIRDPASSSVSHCISARALEEARKAFGTDEDLLLVATSDAEQITDEFVHSFPAEM